MVNPDKWNTGIIQLDNEIYVDSSVLGKIVVTKLKDSWILFEFPVAKEKVNDVGIDYLEKPIHSLKYDVVWGSTYRRPSVKAGVKIIACYTNNISDETLFSILENWKKHFSDIMELANKCLIPEQPTISFVKFEDGLVDFKSGITMYRLQQDGKTIPIHDRRGHEPFKVHIIEEGCYSDIQTVTKAINRAFLEEPITQTYYLLLDAYHAFKKSDYRSSVTLGGIALEHCILEKIRGYAKSKDIVVNYPIGELGRKFEKLKELDIEIPVSEYKEVILKPRNAVLHKGIQVIEDEAYDFLKNCRIIIDEFEPLM